MQLLSYALSSLVLATSLTAASPSNLSQNITACARAASQLSCSDTKNPVDPTSFGTCCYNGALKPGFKESGLVLATQFYDAKPSTGPNDSTTIHGLWPDYCDGTYPQYCTADSGIPTYTGAQIASLIKQYSPKTYDYMTVYYKDISGNDPSFWEHEWNKHGTCFTTLRSYCVAPRNGANQTVSALVGYFEEIVQRFQKLPTFDWLKEAGIVPSTTTTYKLTAIQEALEKKFGATPYIGCSGASKANLDEFWYFYHTYGPIIGGYYVPTPSTTNSSCAAEVSYVPK